MAQQTSASCKVNVKIKCCYEYIVIKKSERAKLRRKVPSRTTSVSHFPFPLVLPNTQVTDSFCKLQLARLRHVPHEAGSHVINASCRKAMHWHCHEGSMKHGRDLQCFVPPSRLNSAGAVGRYSSALFCVMYLRRSKCCAPAHPNCNKAANQTHAYSIFRWVHIFLLLSFSAASAFAFFTLRLLSFSWVVSGS